MATVWIPPLMRDLTGGQAQVSVEGRTLGAIVDALECAHPGVKARLLRGDRLNPSLRAFVDGRAALLGLDEPVYDKSEVLFLPAISGG